MKVVTYYLPYHFNVGRSSEANTRLAESGPGVGSRKQTVVTMKPVHQVKEWPHCSGPSRFKFLAKVLSLVG